MKNIKKTELKENKTIMRYTNVQWYNLAGRKLCSC